MVLVVGSIDTAEDVAVPLPVLNTEINVMCNPPLPIPLHVRTDCKNCAKRKDELQRMANSVKVLAKFQKPPSVTGHRKTSRKKGKMKKYAYYTAAY